MCSVSFLPHTRGFYLGMNRDESLNRPAANHPSIFVRSGRVAIYPTEPAGGSWVGVNDAGLAVALINWYAVSRKGISGRVSRGIVVPALLAGTELEDVRKNVARLPLHDMAAFRVLVFVPRERRVSEFRWNQLTLVELSHPWAPRHWFSSGYDEPRAQEERGTVASKAWREPRAGSLPWLRRLHGSHEPARGPFCFCMHRKDAATVSYTEIVVGKRKAAMRYHDGPLCFVPHAAATLELPLIGGCKELGAIPTNQEIEASHEDHRSTLQSPRRSLLSRRVSAGGKVCAVTR